jgi:hypothetical protein
MHDDLPMIISSYSNTSSIDYSRIYVGFVTSRRDVAL